MGNKGLDIKCWHFFFYFKEPIISSEVNEPVKFFSKLHKMHLWKNLGLILPIFQNCPNFKIWTPALGFPYCGGIFFSKKLMILQFSCRFWLFCPEYPPTSWPQLGISAVSKKILDTRLFSNFIYADERRLCDEYEFTTSTEDASFTQNIPNQRKSEQSNKSCKFCKSSLVMLLCSKV